MDVLSLWTVERSMNPAVPIVVLVNLEVTDRLGIVTLQSNPVRAYNFGAVCDSPGIIPEPNGATG
jgi:hypothetical protein